MGKRNKIRYQNKPKDKVLIALTGEVRLQYRDDAEKTPQKGDLLVHPRNDALHTTRQGEYEATGFSGYFKVDAHDGREWQPVILAEIFPGREHYFAKSERPIDIYRVCADILRGLKGKSLARTYREHYELPVEEEKE